jgi:hypothetical protein
MRFNIDDYKFITDIDQLTEEISLNIDVVLRDSTDRDFESRQEAIYNCRAMLKYLEDKIKVLDTVE